MIRIKTILCFNKNLVSIEQELNNKELNNKELNNKELNKN